jgi:hypothetical protein
MTLEEKYAYWLEAAQYDLDSADAMYNGGRWFYVVFLKKTKEAYAWLLTLKR